MVEVATVTLDGGGRVVDEWDTLVNPERDVGPTHIHGITASMVSAAPCFSDMAAALAQRLHGSVLVAHNLPFDARMLTREYERLDAAFTPGDGVCTLSLCGERLDAACNSRGIEIEHEHRALSDARAAARLFAFLEGGRRECGPARVNGVSSSYSPRTLRRDMLSFPDHETSYLVRLARTVKPREHEDPSILYFDLLDWVLADLFVSSEEWQELRALAGELGMTKEDMEAVHLTYMEELVAAALRDGVVTDGEYELLTRAAAALGVQEGVVEEAVEGVRSSTQSIVLVAGTKVCFTGTALTPDGATLSRSDLERFARWLGLEPVPSVTKKNCDLLVAADPSSSSGKANKARQYGIPIANTKDFLRSQLGGELPGFVAEGMST